VMIFAEYKFMMAGQSRSMGSKYRTFPIHSPRGYLVGKNLECAQR
jgi:hypothetical protein